MPRSPFLPFGAGRSYGDTCLPDRSAVIDTRRLSGILSFDQETGIVEAEAGVTIGALIRHVAPHGWFPPVVPGTQHVTLGGALANDIHGKNHHDAGTFGCHVRDFTLLRSTGERLTCSQRENAALFAATIGGMGLTGLVTRLTLQLMRIPSSDILQTAQPVRDLAHFFALAATTGKDAPYSVAWIDSMARGRHLGRGVFLSGGHASGGTSAPLRERPRLSIPFQPPVSVINRWGLTAFNALYRRKTLAKSGETRVAAGAFFFPLDSIGHWNRLYGPRGLRQHQSVIPLEQAETTIARLLEATHAAGHGSFLTVLKLFGERPSPGMLSFPRPGATLTLDFPHAGHATYALLDRLDALTLAAGGRVNPYKDGRMSEATFRASFPDMDAFRALMDPHARSAFASRVGLTAIAA